MTFRAGSGRLRHGLKVAGAYVPPTLAAPTNVVLPAITENPWEGTTLSVSTGAWNGYPAPTFAYVWKRAGTAITGATAPTYLLISDDTGNAITVDVTATNSQGSATATSSATATVITPPLITATPAGSTLYVSVGDSITAGQYATASYSALFAGTDTTDITFVNGGILSARVSTLEAHAAETDAYIASNPGKANYCLSVLIGTNQAGDTTPSDFLASLISYLDARRAAGWDVSLLTILPQYPQGVAFIDTVNAAIRTYEGVHCDKVIDTAAAPVIGVYTGGVSNTLYVDGLHPTTLGHRYLERAVAAGLSSRMFRTTAGATNVVLLSDGASRLLLSDGTSRLTKAA